MCNLDLNFSSNKADVVHYADSSLTSQVVLTFQHSGNDCQHMQPKITLCFTMQYCLRLQSKYFVVKIKCFDTNLLQYGFYAILDRNNKVFQLFVCEIIKAEVKIATPPSGIRWKQFSTGLPKRRISIVHLSSFVTLPCADIKCKGALGGANRNKLWL